MAPKTSFKQLLTKSGSNPTVNLQNVRAQREKRRMVLVGQGRQVRHPFQATAAPVAPVAAAVTTAVTTAGGPKQPVTPACAEGLRRLWAVRRCDYLREVARMGLWPTFQQIGAIVRSFSKKVNYEDVHGELQRWLPGVMDLDPGEQHGPSTKPYADSSVEGSTRGCRSSASSTCSFATLRAMPCAALALQPQPSPAPTLSPKPSGPGLSPLPSNPVL